MATVEQQLGAKLKKEGVLRLPVKRSATRYGDVENVRAQAEERMRRIVTWTRKEADITYDDEGFIVARLR